MGKENKSSGKKNLFGRAYDSAKSTASRLKEKVSAKIKDSEIKVITESVKEVEDTFKLGAIALNEIIRYKKKFGKKYVSSNLTKDFVDKQEAKIKKLAREPEEFMERFYKIWSANGNGTYPRGDDGNFKELSQKEIGDEFANFGITSKVAEDKLVNPQVRKKVYLDLQELKKYARGIRAASMGIDKLKDELNKVLKDKAIQKVRDEFKPSDSQKKDTRSDKEILSGIINREKEALEGLTIEKIKDITNLVDGHFKKIFGSRSILDQVKSNARRVWSVPAFGNKGPKISITYTNTIKNLDIMKNYYKNLKLSLMISKALNDEYNEVIYKELGDEAKRLAEIIEANKLENAINEDQKLKTGIQDFMKVLGFAEAGPLATMSVAVFITAIATGSTAIATAGTIPLIAAFIFASIGVTAAVIQKRKTNINQGEIMKVRAELKDIKKNIQNLIPKARNYAAKTKEDLRKFGDSSKESIIKLRDFRKDIETPAKSIGGPFGELIETLRGKIDEAAKFLEVKKREADDEQLVIQKLGESTFAGTEII